MPENENTTETAPQEPAAAAPAESPKPTPPAEATETKAANPWDNPDAAKAEIERLRRENASSRTNAKAQAAEDARNEVTQSIAKALGLVQDEAPDPAKLAEQVNAASNEARTLKVTNATILAAVKAGADVEALMDSRSFLEKVGGLDPSAADFTSSVHDAITAALEANPRFKVQASGMKPNPAQGASNTPALTASQQARQQEQAGNWKAASSTKAELLLDLRKQTS